MSLLKCKTTVRPRSLMIAAGVINAANELGITADIVITAGNDGQHMVGSKHYTGDALDVRTKHLSIVEKESLREMVRHRLGSNYDVILESVGAENEHLHVEFDQKQ
jgi:hypothetical protein